MACCKLLQSSHHLNSLFSRVGPSPTLRVRQAPWSFHVKLAPSRLGPHRQYATHGGEICSRCMLQSRIPTRTAIWRAFASATRRSLSFPHKWVLYPMAFAPLSLFRRAEKPPDHTAEVLAQIPKEVFRSDVLVQRKRKRFFLTRLLMKLWSKLRFVLRFLRILLTFGPLLAAYPLTYLGQPVTVFWWKCLLVAMERTGPTFIKLGQWASTRRDLFTAEFCELFYKLHSSTRRHSWFMTQRKLRKAFGKNWRQIFVRVEKKPIGSGCIAQVHKAYMKADMIPDEHLVEECLEDLDEHEDLDEEVDFAEGLEIIGLGHFKDKVDNLIEDVHEARSKHQSTNPPTSDSAEGHSPEVSTESADATSTTKTTASTATNEANTPSEHQETLIPVAVKVLHPGIYRSFNRDLSILRLLSRFMEAFVPSLRWLSLRDAVEEFAELMTQQIDLRFEAECLEEFNDNFEHISYIRFPKPVRPYCKRDVLIETYEEGEPISDFLHDDSDHPQGLREQLAEFGVDALLKMIFLDNLVHGDLHPGNILVQNAADFVPLEESQNKLMLLDVCDTVIVNIKPVDNPVRLVLLDVGIATMLCERDRRNFSDVFTAIVLGEGETVAELMLAHARYNECKDVAGFKRDLGEIVTKARQQTIRLGKIQAGQLLSDVFSILSRHRVKMESNFVSILLAIFVLEGLGRSLDPEMDLLERAKPILLSSS